MKQVFNVKGNAKVRDVPRPICGDGEILVHNIYSSISVGTELKSLTPGSSSMLKMAMKRKDLVEFAIRKAKKDGIMNTYNFAKAMMDNWWPLGYSCVGEVVEVGRNINDISPGDKVACCGQDIANHAEFVTVPRNMASKVPPETDLRQASLSTIGAIVIHSLHRGEVSFGQTVVVYGMGLLGQIAAEILNAAGCKVIGIDISKDRVNDAKLSLGITSASPVPEVMNFTKNRGADVVIITAKADTSEVINNAMEMTRKKGKVVIVGHVNLDLQRKPFYEKELDVLISRAYGPGRHDINYEKKGLDYPIDYVRWTIGRNMESFLDLIHDKKIDLSYLLENEVAITDVESAYKLLQSPGKKPYTIVISYPELPSNPDELEKISASRSKSEKNAEDNGESTGTAIRKKKNVYNIAVVGGGSFAREIHYPLLSANPRFKIKKVLSKTGVSSAQVGEKYGAEKTVSDFSEIANDDSIDLVVIVTPHSEHKKYVIEAIKAGKNVFVEKPMALTWDECLEIQKALEKNPVLFSVGHNKTFSDLAIAIKDLLRSRKSPFVMNYRMQLKMNQKKEWLYDPEIGGGRIIGELCHVYDFINWASGSEAIELSAHAIKSENPTVLPESNLVANVAYKDGSVASVTYSEQGDPSMMAKERIEIFFDNNVIVVEDGVYLTVNGKKSSLTADRGFARHYQMIIDSLDGKSDNELEFGLVGVDRALATMQLTFETLNRIKGVKEF